MVYFYKILEKLILLKPCAPIMDYYTFFYYYREFSLIF